MTLQELLDRFILDQTQIIRVQYNPCLLAIMDDMYKQPAERVVP